VLCGLYAPGLHRVLEYDGAHVGLPLSWLAIYERRKTAQWTCARSPCQEPSLKPRRRRRQQARGKRQHSVRSSPKSRRLRNQQYTMVIRGFFRLITVLNDSIRAQLGLSTLCSEDFLHLTDFLLDFAAHFFILTFGFQVGIVRISHSCAKWDCVASISMSQWRHAA
jgi:hypothetical protein